MNQQPASVPSTMQPGPGLSLTCGYGTDRGLRRELNEDSYIASDPVFAVADGMGGHEAGEVASGLCVRALAAMPQLTTGERTATAAVLQQYLVRADNSIREATGARAGTTLSGAVIVEQMGVPYWLVMNIGDSRTYRLSQGRFEQISVDHSEVQELVDAGEITPQQATVHPRRHVVTRALGTGDETEADYWLLPVEEGDRILVCSDGLTSELTDEHIFRILSTVGQPQDAVDALIQAALRNGGRDNVTVIVVDARNVLNDAGAATTAPRPDSSAEDEVTLPRSQAVQSATQPLPQQDAGEDDAGQRTGQTVDQGAETNNGQGPGTKNEQGSDDNGEPDHGRH
ncbi:protein phosphatase 2C domain-containing protein [Arthrobacter sp. Cr_A7]|uniref:PP2C family protein-serine/threonine phosphatase n=1 Tax=Arthrobacter sp. Cr_A7 TaxID=3031017 RepID=UPI0023DCD05B|nr:protein phosphatase 2C domain-containing protein [Arthrobacter sp. Cr_A7]MDF2051504.1 protein phosphatase 2C domain-containing protein [Arthrobacter sp. Cr_A7]